MKYKTIQEMIDGCRWNSKDPATGTQNYLGRDYSEYISIIGRNRDSDILTNSNFDCALDILGGESEDNGVLVGRFGHWACGWYELILVHQDSPHEILERARILLNDLDDYPVVDEDHWSQAEWDAGTEIIELNEREFVRNFFDAIGFKNPDVTPRARRHEQVMELVEHVYREDAGNSSVESAYVTKDAVTHWLDSGDARWYLSRAARDGNTLARAIMTRFGVKAAA
jgi:hypothetical protein